MGLRLQKLVAEPNGFRAREWRVRAVVLNDCDVVSIEQSQDQSSPPNMIFIPSGTFRMGSDKHYPEEAPGARCSKIIDAERFDE
jgi:formylglycine-generating enzyme required for sulfatase activity